MQPPLPPFPPVSVHVALFLKAVSEGSAASLLVKRRKNAGGSGAAKGVRGGLRFAQFHLGFEFGLGEEEVAAAGLCSPRWQKPKRSSLETFAVFFASLRAEIG